MHFDHC